MVSTLGEIEARIKPPPPKRGSRAVKAPVVKSSEPLQASLIALDPATGEVRAIVGGRDIAGVGLNRACSRSASRALPSSRSSTRLRLRMDIHPQR